MLYTDCLCEAWDNGNVEVGVVQTVCMKCGTVADRCCTDCLHEVWDCGSVEVGVVHSHGRCCTLFS